MMEPIYRCGYQIPSLIKLVFKLICFITIPFLITMMVKNIRSHNNFDDKDDSCQQILPILNNHYFS